MFAAFQPNAFQGNAFQIGAEVASVFPTFGGGGRARWYLIREKKLYLTNEELLWYITNNLIEPTREDIRVTYTNRKPRVIAANAYKALIAASKTLDAISVPKVIEYDDDDEEAILLLM